MKSDINNNRNIIIIPMFNESEKIQSVICGLQREGHENIIVVDDGSTDGGAKLARAAGAHVVTHVVNRGAGASVMTGVNVAFLLGADTVVTFDADGQHYPEDVEELLGEFNNNKNIDVVLGYRDFSAGAMPFGSKMANHVGNIFTWLIFGVWVKDSQSGMRAYSAKALQSMDFDYQGYEYCSALAGQLKKKSIVYLETPITTHYSGYSTTKEVRQNFRNGIKTLIRLLGTSRT